MRTEEMYHRAQEVWIYDQLNPEERLWVGRKPPRVMPAWAEPFPEHLIGLAPEEIDQQERDRRNDEFLAKNGIK